MELSALLAASRRRFFTTWLAPWPLFFTGHREVVMSTAHYHLRWVILFCLSLTSSIPYSRAAGYTVQAETAQAELDRLIDEGIQKRERGDDAAAEKTWRSGLAKALALNEEARAA